MGLDVGDFKGPRVPTLCFASRRQPGPFEVGLPGEAGASAETGAGRAGAAQTLLGMLQQKERKSNDRGHLFQGIYKL